MSTDPSTRATLKQIAAQLGVSVTTVSRVLNGQARQYRISAKTEDEVQALAASLQFQPNPLARGLRLNRTHTIGLLIPEIANPFFAGIAQEVATEVHRRGYALLLCDSQENQALEQQSLEVLRSRSVEGIILCPVGRSCTHLKHFEGSGIPLIQADRIFPNLAVPYVTSDNVGGARDAVRHLVGKGHQRIAALMGLRGTSPNEERLEGYRQGLQEAGLAWDEGLALGDGFDEQTGYDCTWALLESGQDFSAILAFSSLIGLGALRALAEAGRRVPEDISILSFDDQPYHAYLSPPMTAMAQSNAELGQAAVALLFQRMETPGLVPDSLRIPTRLVERRSVR